MAGGQRTIRDLAREIGGRIEHRLRRGAGGTPLAEAILPWPAWSPELLTIWLHLPKTAGTTLWAVLERKFGAGAFPAMQRGSETDSALGLQRPAVIAELWQAFPEAVRKRFSFAGGHLPYGIDNVFGRPCQDFTFVRDPIEQAISFYYFLVEAGLLAPEEASEPGRVNLERAVDEGVFLALHNYQVRVLSGLPGLDPAFGRFPSKEQLAVPNAALELAKRHLDEMFFVGLTEFFDASAIILGQLLGWRLEDLLSIRRKEGRLRPPAVALSAKLRSQLGAINALDLELYDYAKARFRQQAEAYGQEIAAYLPALQALNALAERAGSPEGPIDASAEATVLAAAAGHADAPAMASLAGSAPATSVSPQSPALLDRVPGARGAFGLRLLRRAHQGPVIRLRRIGDGHEEDFGTTREARLPVASIGALLQGSEGAVSLWYDQAGANHAFPAGAPPAYLLSTTVRGPLVAFTPPSSLRASLTLQGAAEFSIFACFRPIAAADAQSLARWDEPGRAFVAFPDQLGNALVGNAERAIGLPLGIVPGEFGLYGIVWRGAAGGQVTAYRNGSVVASVTSDTAPAISDSAATLSIGAYLGTAAYFSGEMAELIIWPRALSEEEVRIVCADMMEALPVAGTAWMQEKPSQPLVMLPATRYARYALPVEYLPSRDLRPRWGHSQPPIAPLHRLFQGHRPRYEAFLDEMARSLPALTDVPRQFREERLPEPAWLGVAFAPFDLLALYTMVRLCRPRRYVEIGSGISTCFAARAVKDHALGTRIVSIDPAPRAAIDAVCDEVIRAGLESCDVERFAELEAGDIVFLDGSHRSFMNSDVTVFMIDVLPRLRPGVIVHVHDVTLPWDYPEMFIDWYWNEQYLLAAYLIGAGERIDPLLPTAFICRDEAFAERLAWPSIDFADDEANAGWRGGGSMWFTHRAAV